jgi:phosphoglycolate phosphatase
MSRYRLIIFDFDGTLADSADWFLGVLGEMAERHGFVALPPDEMQRLRGLPNREIIKALKVRPWRLPFIARDMRTRAAADIHRIQQFDGVADVLRALAVDGVRVAVVSSNAEANVRRVLGDAAGAVTDFACGSSLFGKARLFSQLMRRAGVAPSETLCIGDEQRDIEAAQGAGANSGAVLWGYAEAEFLRGCQPTHAFERPANILQVVRG